MHPHATAVATTRAHSFVHAIALRETWSVECQTLDALQRFHGWSREPRETCELQRVAKRHSICPPGLRATCSCTCSMLRAPLRTLTLTHSHMLARHSVVTRGRSKTLPPGRQSIRSATYHERRMDGPTHRVHTRNHNYPLRNLWRPLHLVSAVCGHTRPAAG